MTRAIVAQPARAAGKSAGPEERECIVPRGYPAVRINCTEINEVDARPRAISADIQIDDRVRRRAGTQRATARNLWLASATIWAADFSGLSIVIWAPIGRMTS